MKHIFSVFFKKTSLFLKKNLIYVIGCVLVVVSIILFSVAGEPEITEKVRDYVGGRWTTVEKTRANIIFYVFVILGTISALVGIFLVVFQYFKFGRFYTNKINEQQIEKKMIEQRLDYIKELLDNEVISDIEYNEMRKKIINSLLDKG